METDFGSMTPKAKSRAEAETIAQAKEQERLEKQTAFLAVVNSESSKILLDLINKKLTERINELCDNDPEASLCIKILSELGLQKSTAEQAAKELEKLYLQKE